MKKNPKKCLTKHCRGQSSKTGHSPYCSKCRSRRWKEKFPLHAAFHNLKHRANERGIEVTITREEFVAFAIKSGLDKLHGREKYCLTVDRIDERKGYVRSNIRSITKSDNSSRKKYVSYFRNKAARDAAIAEADKRATIALKISEELEKQFHPDSDEFRAAYTQRTNEVFATV